MIIDSHAHIYPDKISIKATKAIGDFYDLDMSIKSGTAENLLLIGKQAGIDKFLVHSVATKKEQVKSINDFIYEKACQHKEFIPFMTLHQDLTEQEIENEVLRCIERGFKGIKLHPDFQKFNVDGESADKIYRAVSRIGKKMPILMHMGDDRFDFSAPEKLVAVAKKYPDLTFIAAHFGGYRVWNKAEKYKGLKNVYFDTSSSLAFLTVERATYLIKYLGADRFFFGSDFPMWRANEELERLNALELTKKEKEGILSKNLIKLLDL